VRFEPGSSHTAARHVTPRTLRHCSIIEWRFIICVVLQTVIATAVVVQLSGADNDVSCSVISYILSGQLPLEIVVSFLLAYCVIIANVCYASIMRIFYRTIIRDRITAGGWL